MVDEKGTDDSSASYLGMESDSEVNSDLDSNAVDEEMDVENAIAIEEEIDGKDATAKEEDNDEGGENNSDGSAKNVDEENLNKEDKVETIARKIAKRSKEMIRNKNSKITTTNEDEQKSSGEKKLASGSSDKVAVENEDKAGSSQEKVASGNLDIVVINDHNPNSSGRKTVAKISSGKAAVVNIDKTESRGDKLPHGSSEGAAAKNEHNPESSRIKRARGTSSKKDTKKVKSMGMIFMCNSKTRKDCYHYKVLGLPANKKELVDKVYKGMRLFLYDVDLRLMYGIYRAAGPGGYNIEPKAFKSQFPSQVRFTILEDCRPLPEEKFRKVIKDNYFSRTKFDCQLNSEQVKKLCTVFTASSKSLSKRSGETTLVGKRRYHGRPYAYERRIVAPIESPRARARRLPVPISGSSYAYEERSIYGQDPFYRDRYTPDRLMELDESRIQQERQLVENVNPYRREHLADGLDPYRRDHGLQRDSLVERRNAYRQDHLVEHIDIYQQPARLEHLDHGSRRQLENVGSYRRDILPERGELYRQDSLLHHDLRSPIMEPLRQDDVRSAARLSYIEPPVNRDWVYSLDRQRDYYPSSSRVLPEYQSARSRYRL